MIYKILITTYVDGARPAPSSVVAEFRTEEDAADACAILRQDTSHKYIRYHVVPLNYLEDEA